MLLACAPFPAAAHGFGQRFDLPLPLWLWVAGAGATIVLTFATIALFFRETTFAAEYPRMRLLDVRPGVVAFIRSLCALVFILAVCAGFLGMQDPYRNLITTMVWVLWWAGFAFVCGLIVDLWALGNPLRTIFAWGEALYAALGRGPLSRELPYPPRLAAWPAVALFLCFAWAELVWRENDVPAYLACAVSAYAAITWTGMFLFGRETWLERGEAFALAFGLLGRFAPLQCSGRRLDLTLPGTGLASGRPAPPSLMVFVLLMLATVSFDGFLETPLMRRLETALLGSPLLFRLSEWGLDESQVVATAALLVFPLVFLGAYGLACWAMTQLTRRAIGVGEAAGAFVLTLVPIAVAYHLSHYFSLLVTAGQFIIPLASDPFGFGWDLFGTARYKIDLGILSPYVFWYGAVTLIVVGHVIAVVLAHAAALRVFGSHRDALVSQIPMVALMVAYTMLSLWILAQPIVE